MSPFDPMNLEPPVSLNRVIVADLPGLELDRGVRGKTGYELLSARALATLFPALPTEPGDASADPENHVERAWRLLDRFVTVIDQTRVLALGVLRQRGYDVLPDQPVLASLAAYMPDGHPLAAQRGTYMQWIHITRNARDLIAERLADRWGVHVPVTLAHDGTAAAAAHAGDDPRATAVITMGTALGIGFPPKTDSVCPLAASFEITAST
jgi:hypothetical protein